MKVLVLSSAPNAGARLKEEGEKRGIDVIVEDPHDLYPYVSKSARGYDGLFKKTEGKSQKLKLSDFDAIIPRIAGEGSFEFGCMIVRHINHNLNKFSTGSEFGLKVCSNKFLNAQFLSRQRIRVPKQVLAHRPTDYKELINLVGGLPCVGKLQRGSMGEGVFILNNELAASTALNSMENLGADIVLQQFINSGSPANDIRAFVIGAETEDPKVFAYRRFSLAADFRSNYSISGMGEQVELTEVEREMAINASKALRLGVCGVDIMRDVDNDDTPYCIETNGCPGLKGVEAVTGENVAGAIIDYVIDNWKKGGESMDRDFDSNLLIHVNDQNNKARKILSDLHQVINEAGPASGIHNLISASLVSQLKGLLGKEFLD